MVRTWMTAAILAATLAAGAVPAVAAADEWRGGGYGYGYDRGDYDRGRDWRQHEWREHARREYYEHAYRYGYAPRGYYGYGYAPRVIYVPPYGY